jgi:hypothetical protein
MISDVAIKTTITPRTFVPIRFCCAERHTGCLPNTPKDAKRSTSVHKTKVAVVFDRRFETFVAGVGDTGQPRSATAATKL